MLMPPLPVTLPLTTNEESLVVTCIAILPDGSLSCMLPLTVIEVPGAAVLLALILIKPVPFAVPFRVKVPPSGVML